MGELLKELSSELSTLIKQEMELAKAELRTTGKRAGIGAGLVGGGAAVGYLAAAAFTAFLVLLINEVTPAWLAALIVAVVYGVIAALLAMRGRDKVKEAMPPAPATTETVKEDIRWAKNPTRSAGR
ncbi:MAG: phage holin family protein [Actinobacteria bacterium]|nr:phage holin family protein [Actinomycetota bacterium]